MKPTTYLNFDGNCAEALEFYTRVLHAEVKDVMYNRDAEKADRMDAADDAVLNAFFTIGDVPLMASDAGSYYVKPQGFAVHLELDSASEAKRVWEAMSEGAEVQMPMAGVFWAEQFGMLTDRFGTPWMVSYGGERGDAMMDSATPD